jgi:hypothetical protein
MDPAFVAKVRSFYDGVKGKLAASLVEGQRLGIVAPGDAQLLATFTVGALKELLTQNVSAETPLAREEIVTALFAFLRAGYLRTGEAAPRAPPPVTPEDASPARRRRRR